VLIATLPPYVRHRDAIARHAAVDALRFNTVMPVAESPREVLATLREICGRKPLWVDLKARQLRITRFAYLPYAEVEISRKRAVELPAKVLFKDGEAEIVRVIDGDRLILGERPARVVGAGEPITILDESLEIEGYLTEGDRAYVRAAVELGIHDYMLSFVESEADLEELRALDPEARVIAKIESRRGLAFVERSGVRLMAARDDLFRQLGNDGREMIAALERIVARDPEAICASRLLESLEAGAAVSFADVADVALMARLGYRAFMLSDGVCFSERAFERAIRAFAELDAWLPR
jgi:pyruvate kinase